MTATISISERLRDRLKTYGHAGQTYEEILQGLMDDVDRERFVAWMRRRADEVTEWVDLEDID